MRGLILIIIIAVSFIGYQKKSLIASYKDDAIEYFKKKTKEWNITVVEQMKVNKTNLDQTVTYSNTFEKKSDIKTYKVFDGKKVSLKKTSAKKWVKTKIPNKPILITKSKVKLTTAEATYYMLEAQKLAYSVKNLRLKETKYGDLSLNSFSPKFAINYGR